VNKRGVGFILVILLALVTSTALATSHTYIQNYRTLAGVTVAYPQLKIEVTPIVGSKWRGEIKSFTSNPVFNIDRIGWNYWTMRQWCGGSIQVQYQFNGGVDYQANSFTLFKDRTLEYCNPGDARTVSIAAKHDFAEASDVHLT